jgi:autophagy-related protein 18
VSFLTFNHNGTMLATASDKGTVIRIFSVPDSKRLYQLRRGSTQAKIFYISFNMQSNMVVVSSDNSTIHIFKLFSISPSNALISGYLPEFVSEMWEPARDFALLKVVSTQPAIAALSPSSPHVMAVTSDGYFQLYSINLETGGECLLLKQFPLTESVTDEIVSTEASPAATVPAIP